MSTHNVCQRILWNVQLKGYIYTYIYDKIGVCYHRQLFEIDEVKFINLPPMYFKIRYVLPDCFKAAELHCNRYDYVLTNWIRALSAHTIISFYSQSKTGFVVISNSSVGHREMVQHNFRKFSFPEMHQSILLSTTIGSTKEDNYPIQSSHKQHCWAKLQRILCLTSHNWHPQEKN